MLYLSYVGPSDDITWCKNNIVRKNVYSEGLRPVENLALLGFCNHTVISCTHSSYARWSSWYANETTVARENVNGINSSDGGSICFF